MDHNITLLQRNNDDTVISGYAVNQDNSQNNLVINK